MHRGEAQDVLEREIAGERAGSLARAVEALDEALTELRRAPRVTRDHLLEQAGERLWFVVVQREALGLSRHDIVYEVLRVPPEVRRAMGPARGPRPAGRRPRRR